MNIKDNLEFLSRLAKGISEHFGGSCEVVVHDFENGFENTLVIVENGHITNRKVGDDASEAVLEALHSGEKPKDHISYMTRTKDGKILKSTTIHILNEAGEAVGIFGLNFDITNIMLAQGALNSIVSLPNNTDKDQDIYTIPGNVTELLDNLVDEACRFVGKDAQLMSKADKVTAVQYLDDKGAFLIKKAADKVANYFGISKFTLYNYLGEGKGG